MPQQLPLTLLVSWVLFFASGLGHFHYERALRRSGVEDPELLRATEISQSIWIVAAFSILAYYFAVGSWYWPLALVIAGSTIGAVLAGLLFGAGGEGFVSKRGFFVWPLSAVYAVFAIHSMPS